MATKNQAYPKDGNTSTNNLIKTSKIETSNMTNDEDEDSDADYEPVIEENYSIKDQEEMNSHYPNMVKKSIEDSRR